MGFEESNCRPERPYAVVQKKVAYFAFHFKASFKVSVPILVWTSLHRLILRMASANIVGQEQGQ